MAGALLYTPRLFIIDANGDPLSGGKVYTYETGTATPKAAYQDQALTTPHANPIILDSNGSAEIWLDGFYTIDIFTSGDVQFPGYPIDDVSTAPASTVATTSEWVSPADVPTFISSTQFSVPNDKTSTYLVGRRVQCTVTAGTVYGRITVSSFAASITTVTVVLDSGNLDSGLSVVNVGILTPTNHSIPKASPTLDKPLVSDATALTGVPAVQQVNSGELVYVADTGVADAYIATFVPAFTAYTTGMRTLVKIANANLTTTPVIDFNGLGDKTIKKGAAGIALVAGDLPAGYFAEFIYDGTDMILQNPATSGLVVQTVYTPFSEVATGTTVIPIDDSIPQNTEGDEYMTRAITPTDANNILEIEMTVVIAHSVSNASLVHALFQDSTADALAAVAITKTSGGVETTTWKHEMVAGTTSSTTFKLRSGSSSAGTTTFNGLTGARLMGGVMESSMTIRERKA